MNKSLVLVLGAGASKEVSMPTGNELKEQIEKALDFSDPKETRQWKTGAPMIRGALNNIAERFHLKDGKQLLPACWHIRDAMPQASSIDQFIHSNRDKPEIQACGKLAIVHCILQAESQSDLQIMSKVELGFRLLKDSWFTSFFRLLFNDRSRHEVRDRLSQVAIISFNYDRCVMRYLHAALQNHYYEMNPDEASDALSKLEIFHPYGSVGALPWQRKDPSIEYGKILNSEELIDASSRIRTFTEGIDPENSEIETIRAIAANAERLVFLGFAFHKLNVDLLFPGLADGESLVNRSVYATGFGLSESDCIEITGDLCDRGAILKEKFYLRNDLTCAQLFTEYGRSFALQ